VTALNPRQQRTVDRLLDAGEVELREAGLDAVTVRTVAARAGVSSATAYTYLASKDHLFALMFLRHLQASAPEITGDRPVTRVQSLTRALAADLASSPELAAAATRALLGTDPAVDRVRRRIGAEYAARFRTALGDAAGGGVLDTLLLTFLGALLQAGMGMSTYPAVAEQLQRSIELILR
jgi:AcrR family transcriptional regulator